MNMKENIVDPANFRRVLDDTTKLKLIQRQPPND